MAEFIFNGSLPYSLISCNILWNTGAIIVKNSYFRILLESRLDLEPYCWANLSGLPAAHLLSAVSPVPLPDCLVVLEKLCCQETDQLYFLMKLSVVNIKFCKSP